MNSNQQYAQLSFEEIEQNISSLSLQNKIVESLSLANYLEINFPKKARGYLCQYDIFSNLGLNEHAERVIDRAFNSGLQNHELINNRYIDLLLKYRLWDEVVNIYKTIDKKSDQLGSISVDCAINIKDFESAKVIANSLSANIKDTYLSKIKSAIKKETDKEAISDEEALSSLKNSIREKNLSQCEYYSWIIYQRKITNIESLIATTEIFHGEFEYYPRVIFFRNWAYKQRPDLETIAQRYSISIAFQNRFHAAYKAVSAFYNSKDGLTQRICNNLSLITQNSAFDLESSLHSWNPEYADKARIRASNLASRIDHGSFLQSHLPVTTSDHKATKELIRPSKNFIESARATSIPRVAICISGQMRGFDKNWPNLKMLADRLNADLFIHTWDKQTHAPPLFRRLDRFIGNDLARTLPSYLSQTSQFSSRFPKTAAVLQKKFESVVKSEDFNFTDAKAIAIEREEEFEKTLSRQKNLMIRGNFNQCKMYYKIQRCDNLRRAHELIDNEYYNCVVRIRPDACVEVPDIEHYIDICASRDNKVFTHYVTPDGVGDQFLIASSKAMEAIAETWSFAEKYGTWSFGPNFSTHAAEPLLGDICYTAGLEVEYLPTSKFSLVTELVVDRLDIRPALIQDTEGTETLDINAFLSAVENHYRKKNSALNISVSS